MKKTYLLLIFYSAITTLNGQGSNVHISPNSFMKVDKIIESVWDVEKADWLIKNNISYNYTYENGEVVDIITVDYFTGIPVNRLTHYYSPEKILLKSVYQNWVTGNWINNRRDLWFINEDELVFEELIQFWQDDTWTNSIRYTDYQYDYRLLIHYIYQKWINGQWIDSSNDWWSYDENGNLVLRQTIGVNNIPMFKYVYEVNGNNLRTSLTIYIWNSNSWLENTRRVYEYDQCRKINAVVYQVYENGIWANLTKQKYFYSFNNINLKSGYKVPICHNGHTIYVSPNAIKAHLAHGDCIGECIDEKEIGERDFKNIGNLKEFPFKIYPNPANDKVIIKIDDNECRGPMKVELTDFYGKLIKSFNIYNNSELTIYRNNLISGKYYIKLIGEEVFSAVVIFE